MRRLRSEFSARGVFVKGKFHYFVESGGKLLSEVYFFN